jgi:WD40 repeat protein
MGQSLLFWPDYLDPDTKRTLAGHRGTITDISVTEDSRFAATSSRDETARYWDLKSGRCLYVRRGYSEWVETISVSQTGQAATIDAAGRLDVFSARDGRPRWAIDIFDKYIGNNSYWIKHAQFIEKGRRLLAASGSDSALKVVMMDAVEDTLSRPVQELVNDVRGQTRLLIAGQELLPRPSERLVVESK